MFKTSTQHELDFRNEFGELKDKVLQAKFLSYKIALADPWYFIKNFVYTLDPHSPSQPIRKFPDKKYLEELTNIWLANPLLAVAKSRQMMATWLFSALYLWDTLHKGKLNFFQSKKEEDANSVLDRSKFIYSYLPTVLKWGAVDYSTFRDLSNVPAPTARDVYCNLSFPWLHSEIVAIPQGGDVIRMHTASGIFSDEDAFQEEAEAAFEAAKPTIEGGGRLTKASSPNGQNAFYSLLNAPGGTTPQSPMTGIRTSKNLRNGFMSCWLHYSADPEKDAVWALKVKEGMLNENSYLKEYELDFSALEGVKVLGNAYIPTTHLLGEAEDEIDVDSDKGLDVGLDWGFSHPALLLTQFTKEDQWKWLRELVGENMQITTFLDIVCYLLNLENFPHMSEENMGQESLSYIRDHRLEPFIPKLNKNIKIKFYVDVAGTQKSDKGEKTNIQIAQALPYCMRLRYKKVFIEPSVTLLSMRFRVRKDGKPGVKFSKRCPIVLDGLQGGFVRDKRGEIKDTIHTHIFDCGRYILSNVSNITKEQAYLRDQKEEKNFWSTHVHSTHSFIPRKIPKHIEDRFIVNRMPKRKEVRQYA